MKSNDIILVKRNILETVFKDQQEQGTIELFSYIIDSRVFIDEDFVGYTTGDRTISFNLKFAGNKINYD